MGFFKKKRTQSHTIGRVVNWGGSDREGGVTMIQGTNKNLKKNKRNGRKPNKSYTLNDIFIIIEIRLLAGLFVCLFLRG